MFAPAVIVGIIIALVLVFDSHLKTALSNVSIIFIVTIISALLSTLP